MNSILSCHNLHKSFHDGTKELEILRGINFSILPNQSVAILGVSGAGKSTLLHLLGGLDVPSQGEVFWGDKNIQQLSETERCKLRNQQLGFVYQFHHLLPEFNALENVALPLMIGNTSASQALKLAAEMLDMVGLSARITHKIGELSGGERQRVAIARAMVTRPKCILADEPTGNLDKQTAEKILHLMVELQHELGISFIVATHDLALASAMQQQYTLVNGKL